MCSIITIENLSMLIIDDIEKLINYTDLFIKNNNYEDNLISKLMTELDLYHKIDTFIRYIDKAQHVNEFVKNETQSVRTCLCDISKQLDIINYRLKYNKSLWITISSIRSFKFNNRINELYSLLIVLSCRMSNVVNYCSLNNIMTYKTVLGDSFD